MSNHNTLRQVGDALGHLAEKRGFTVSELAQACGVARSTMWRAMTGRTMLRPQTLGRAVIILDPNTEDLARVVSLYLGLRTGG
jgi:transcriptional regulator with XRE-family HTH domain